MNRSRHTTVKVLLWVISVYHMAAGIAATFFKDRAVALGSHLFGVAISMDGQTELLVRYLGAFGIAFGVLAAWAALDPAKNRPIIIGLVVYFAVRAFDRVMFASLLEAFHVGPAPNWLRIVVILAFAVSLLCFMPRRDSAAA